MIELRCPWCDRKLCEVTGSYHISINCPRCKKIIALRSPKVTLETVQHDFENQLAQTGMRANKPQ